MLELTYYMSLKRHDGRVSKRVLDNCIHIYCMQMKIIRIKIAQVSPFSYTVSEFSVQHTFQNLDFNWNVFGLVFTIFSVIDLTLYSLIYSFVLFILGC